MNEVVQIALENGLNIDTPNKKGRTALHYASEFGNLETIRILVSKGANLEVQDKDGKLPVDLASMSEISRFLNEGMCCVAIVIEFV